MTDSADRRYDTAAATSSAVGRRSSNRAPAASCTSVGASTAPGATPFTRSEAANIIALESALADVNYEIETLTGSLRHYDNLVGFSTICLNLSEVRDLTAVQETPSFGSELKQAFLSGSRGFVNFLQNLLLLLAACWPFLVVLIAAVIAVLLLLRRRKIARRNALDAEINDQCDQNEKETK